MLASVPRPYTAVSGTSRLRRAPSAYSRAQAFVGPQTYTLTTGKGAERKAMAERDTERRVREGNREEEGR